MSSNRSDGGCVLVAVEHLDFSAVDKMFEGLRTSLRDAKAAQAEINQVTGTAWSDDHLIKVVVGPRGQLVELEIDPRAVRRVNTEALAATILATARAAAEEAFDRTRGLVERDQPEMRAALGTDLPSAANLAESMFGHDADLAQATRKDDRERGE